VKLKELWHKHRSLVIIGGAGGAAAIYYLYKSRSSSTASTGTGGAYNVTDNFITKNKKIVVNPPPQQRFHWIPPTREPHPINPGANHATGWVRYNFLQGERRTLLQQMAQERGWLKTYEGRFGWKKGAYYRNRVAQLRARLAAQGKQLTHINQQSRAAWLKATGKK
jgi:hypothetical protein